MSENNSGKSSKSRLFLIILFLVLAIAALLLLKWNNFGPIASDNSIQKEKEQLQQQIAKLEEEIKVLSSKANDSFPAGQSLRPSDSPSGISSPPTDLSCTELADSIRVFFDHLDGQEYMVHRKVTSGTQELFRMVVKKLFNNPPVVVRETDSLFTILTNTAHFYRVIGNDNVLLIKDVLLREKYDLEQTFALFYQWSLIGEQCSDEEKLVALPLQNLYEYSGFFLNTLGGQAYLFRRDSHIRLLVKYYCVLILDRANSQVINRHGIDITPHLESVMREMEVSADLQYREYYLDNLRSLSTKYQVLKSEDMPGNYTE